MIETRYLIRDVLITCPDGQGVRSSEVIEVELRYSGGVPDAKQESYHHEGDWRLLPRTFTPVDKKAIEGS